MSDAIPPKHRVETKLAGAGIGVENPSRSVAPPINLAVNYVWNDPLDKPAHDYSRGTNPTRDILQNALSELEGAAGGVFTASGMGAIDLILYLVDPGDLVLAPHDCYGGTHRLLTARAKKGHYDLELVDQTDDKAFEAAIAKGPKLVLIETPSNPLLRITDIKRWAAAAKAAGAIVVADNTFLSPALQKPLALGCDIVVHSTTKFINGHSDVVGGAALAKDEDVAENLRWWANCLGLTGGAFDSYQTLRGLRTLFARIERQQATAGRFIEALKTRPEVATIYYPGLKDHPGHALAAAQQEGFGAMVSVEFEETVDVVGLLRRFEIFTIAESLGGFESLACVPAVMTHAAMPPEARAQAGLTDTLVRFAIGLEHPEDLINDVFAALDSMAQN